MIEMSKAKIARFLMQGTFTRKLATVKEDGSPPLSSVNQTQINGSASASVDAGIGIPGVAATN